MKFTSTLLCKAWALAKQAAGEGSSRRFFGWALKEVRMEETKPEGETQEDRLAKLPNARLLWLVMLKVGDGLSFDEAFGEVAEMVGLVADTKPAAYIGPTGSTGYYGPNGFD